MELAAMSNKVNIRYLSSTGCFLRLLRVRRISCRPRTFYVTTPSGLSRCHSRLMSHHAPFPYPDIPTTEAAKSFLVHLDDKGRSLLLQELQRFKEQTDKSDVLTESATKSVSRTQIKHVILFHGIPFIGFGILDNMIMIIAGEYIDVTIGALLGISTMAAAALGNLISDLAGVGTAGYVELLASKVGVYPPVLTAAQASTWQIRWSVGIGRSLGITVGCLIGMFPLFFYNREDDDENRSADKQTRKSTEKQAS